MKTSINPFDIVKFAPTAEILTTSPNAVDFIGVVREANDRNVFVEWFNKKSKTSTAEALTDYTWYKISDIEVVGSLYHTLKAGLTPATLATATSTEAKPKRKYTRKEGAAKPGPKPKKEKAVKAAKPKKVEPETPATPQIVYVERPVDKRGNPITAECGQYYWQKKQVLATGKFKYFKKRDYIVDSVKNAGCNYNTKIDWSLDFVILGENPGPAKLQKFKYFNIPTITEEQWLAMIGDPIFKFKDEQETA